MKWWDVRKLATPIETLMLDMTKGEEQSLSKALGASTLEYEPTIPTRFMVSIDLKINISSEVSKPLFSEYTHNNKINAQQALGRFFYFVCSSLLFQF